MNSCILILKGKKSMQKTIKFLSQRKYYIIYSVITKRIYLGEEYECYVFETKSDAQNYIEILQEQNEKTYHGESVEINEKNLTDIIDQGAKKLVVQLRDKEDFLDIKLTEMETKRKRYTNQMLQGLICRLKQTKKAKYLRGMKKAKFIMPILLDKREKKNFPSFHYIYATMGRGVKYYVLFSTLYEFEEWNKRQEKSWKCIEIIMEDFEKIRQGNAIIINPLSDMLVLTSKQAEMIHINKKKR